MLFFFVLNEAPWIKWIIFDLSFSIFEIKHYFCGMLRIVGHIEHLLSVHDCVIVPDFGGFVVQTLPVRYDAGMHRFEPMRKDIVFNETLQYNDGLLIEAYMQAEKTDYRTARQLMHEDVALLRAGLQRDSVLKMENIGSFSMGEEGQLIFQADEAGWLNAPMLGLEDFTFEPLSEQMPEAMALPEKKKAAIGVRGIRLQKKDVLENVYLFQEGTETKVTYGKKTVTLNRLKTAKRDGTGTKTRQAD